MDPNQLLLEAKQKIDEGLLSLEGLEHQCLRSSATNGELLKEVHEVRAKLQTIRSSVDTLVSISGAQASPSQELRPTSATIHERVHQIVKRINQIRRKAEQQ